VIEKHDIFVDSWAETSKFVVIYFHSRLCYINVFLRPRHRIPRDVIMLTNERGGLHLSFEILKLLIHQETFDNLVAWKFDIRLVPILIFLHVSANVCFKQTLQIYHILVFQVLAILGVRLSCEWLLKDSPVYVTFSLLLPDFLLSY